MQLQTPVHLLLVFVLMEQASTLPFSYRLIVNRALGSNLISLRCRKASVSSSQDVAFAKFWRTTGDISIRVHEGAEYEFTLTPEKEGYYNCGEDTITTASDSIVLLAHPRLNPGTRDFYSVSVGTPFTSLDCGVTAGALSMMYVVRWVRGLTTLDPQPGERIQQDQQTFSLSIDNAQLSDGAVYQCTVTIPELASQNSATQQVTLLTHDIEVSPSDQQTLVVEPGQVRNVTFTCLFMARSGSQALEPTAVSLGWSHDGRGLTDDGEKYSIVNVNTSMTSVTTEYIVSSTLMIYDVGLIDSGEYDCVVNVVIVIAGTDRAETVTVSEGRKLFVLDDEIELDLFTNSLDGIVAFCLTNLPSPVSDFQTARFKMKMTEVDQRSGEVNAENFEVYGSGRDLQVVDDTELCYEVHLDQIRARITYKVVRVQVALVFDGQTGLFLPYSVDDAEEIELYHEEGAGIEEEDSSSESIKFEVVVGAVIVVLLVVIVMATLSSGYYLRWRYLNREARRQEEAADKATNDETRKFHMDNAKMNRKAAADIFLDAD